MKAFVALFASFFVLSVVGQQHFFPFGSNFGDTAAAVDDDGVSEAISFSFKFYNKKETKLFVNNNGFLNFREESDDWITPLSDVTSPSIAPFWVDTNIEDGGDIWYRTVEDNTTLQVAQTFVRATLVPDFEVKSMFLATWDRIAPYIRGVPPSDELRNTFQVALVASATQSIVVFNYGDLEFSSAVGTNEPAQVGLGNANRGYVQMEASGSDAIKNVNQGSNLLVDGQPLVARYAWIVSPGGPRTPVIISPARSSTSAVPPISGTASPQTEVKVYIDGELYATVKTNSKGEFLVLNGAKLALGTHSIYAEGVYGTSKTSTFRVVEKLNLKYSGIFSY